LGEGWGEGVAEYLEKKTLLHLFLSALIKQEEKEVFWVSSLGPHPDPLPKGEGVIFKFFSHR
jgi:hypothetical protein